MVRVIACCLLALACIGCDPGPTPPNPAGQTLNTVPVLPEEKDTELVAATQKAQATLGQFQVAIKSPATPKVEYSIKAKFVDGAKAEQIWLANVTFDGAQYRAKIGNAPLEVANVTLNQDVAVAPKDVLDWMIIDNGKLIGGYTVRVLRSRMKEPERKEFDMLLGITAD